jgi:hypothetical protein
LDVIALAVSDQLYTACTVAMYDPIGVAEPAHPALRLIVET